MLIAAAALWAAYTPLFRFNPLSPIQAAALFRFWSVAFLLPLYLFLGLCRTGHASTSEMALQAVFQGVLMNSVALVTFHRAVSLLGASAASAVIALLPAAASILAVPLLAETPSGSQVAAVIVLGVPLAP